MEISAWSILKIFHSIRKEEIYIFNLSFNVGSQLPVTHDPNTITANNIKKLISAHPLHSPPPPWLLLLVMYLSASLSAWTTTFPMMAITIPVPMRPLSTRKGMKPKTVMDRGGLEAWMRSRKLETKSADNTRPFQEKKEKTYYFNKEYIFFSFYCFFPWVISSNYLEKEPSCNMLLGSDKTKTKILSNSWFSKVLFPYEPFRNFRASKSVDRQILCNSRTSYDAF